MSTSTYRTLLSLYSSKSWQLRKTELQRRKCQRIKMHLTKMAPLYYNSSTWILYKLFFIFIYLHVLHNSIHVIRIIRYTILISLYLFYSLVYSMTETLPRQYGDFWYGNIHWKIIFISLVTSKGQWHLFSLEVWNTSLWQLIFIQWETYLRPGVPCFATVALWYEQ